MVSKTVTIEAPNGMHARPVSALVALVKASGQQVTLRTPAKSVSGARKSYGASESWQERYANRILMESGFLVIN